MKTSTPRAYAAGTSVSVEKSRAEIDTLLGKHGAEQRGIFTGPDLAQVGFVIGGRKYRLDVPLPSLRDYRGDEKRHAQSCRERWRCVVLLIKSKLELVRLNISTAEKEFMADMVLPDGSTVGQTIHAYIERLIASGYSGPLALPETTTGDNPR